MRILLVERSSLRDLAEPKFDGRDIALTQSSQRRLRALGAWDRIPPADISLLKRASVLNGQSAFALNFDNRRSREALGVLVSNSAIRKALFDTVRAQPNCEIITDHAVVSIRAVNDHAAVELSDGRALKAKLAVAADTRFSPLRQAQGISARMVDFGRTMLVCRIAHATPHDGIATEWFGYGQTLAMLPLAGGQSSYILTLPGRELDGLMEMAPEAFALDAQARTQGRWGRLELASTRHTYPLVAVYADKFAAKRFALVGDAAVGMHPVTAHGYNFGLAGAVRLADGVARAAKRGGDIGADALLVAYERAHRRATWPLFIATNALAKLYSDDRALPRLARSSGLHLMQAFAPVRQLIEARLRA